MRDLILRNEKSLSDIVDSAYNKIADSDRKAIEAALIKANTELKGISKMPKGTLIRVPSVREATRSGKQTIVSPQDSLADMVARHLSSLESQFEKDFDLFEQIQREQTAVFSDISKAVKDQPGGAEAAKALKKHLGDSKKTYAENKKRGLAGLKKLHDTLALLKD